MVMPVTTTTTTSSTTQCPCNRNRNPLLTPANLEGLRPGNPYIAGTSEWVGWELQRAEQEPTAEDLAAHAAMYYNRIESFVNTK